MIDRGADHRQADGDVHPRLQAEHLDRAVALIVVHRHHEVVVAPARQEEQGVGGQRPLDPPAPGPAGLHRRRDLLRLLAAAEEAVLARMRVDRADADPRIRESRLDQSVVAARDHPLDEARLDPRDGVDQPDMRRDVDHPELGRDQHHRDFRRAGERGQKLGMARIPVPGGVQRLLAQGRGADRRGLAGLDHLDGALDVAERRFAGDRRDAAERVVLRDQPEIDAGHGAGCVGRLAGRGDGLHRQVFFHDAAGLAQALGIADHDGSAERRDVGPGERLHDDLGADAGGIAHGDRDGRSAHVGDPSCLIARR